MAQEAYPLSKDRFIKAAEFEGVQKNSSKFLTKGKVGVAAAAMVFAGSNADEVSRWSQHNNRGAMVLAPDGCDITPAPSNNQPKKLAEAAVASTTSAARQFNAGSVNLGEVASQSMEYAYSRIDEFTMPQSGIEVAIHAPHGVEVDRHKFAELFHAPLSESVNYTHPEVSQLMDCLRRDIIQDKKYAGSVYHINIAPPGHCISGMRFQDRRDVQRCDAVGATLPQIEISFLGMDLVNHNLMMLSTSKTGPQAGPALSKTLLHEAGHAYLTLSDVPLRLDPDEKLVEYIEETTLTALYPRGVPIAILYP